MAQKLEMQISNHVFHRVLRSEVSRDQSAGHYPRCKATVLLGTTNPHADGSSPHTAPLPTLFK